MNKPTAVNKIPAETLKRLEYYASESASPRATITDKQYWIGRIISVCSVLYDLRVLNIVERADVSFYYRSRAMGETV